MTVWSGVIHNELSVDSHPCDTEEVSDMQQVHGVVGCVKEKYLIVDIPESFWASELALLYILSCGHS